MKVLIIVPVYNEEDNILKVIDGLNVIIINNIFNMGYARSIQTGIKYAYKNGYDYVIEFDGDNQHIPEYIPKLLSKAQKDNADIVIGSRYLIKGYYKGSFFRKAGSKFFSILIKLFCKRTITDPLSGMQCLNKKVIKKYSTMEIFPDYIDANLLIEMIFNGYKISEVPVKMRQRSSGESMYSGILEPIKYMVRMIYFILLILIIRGRR